VRGGKAEVGLEFTVPRPAFWRVAFPPEDWSPKHPDARKDNQQVWIADFDPSTGATSIDFFRALNHPIGDSFAPSGRIVRIDGTATGFAFSSVADMLKLWRNLASSCCAVCAARLLNAAACCVRASAASSSARWRKAVFSCCSALAVRLAALSELPVIFDGEKQAKLIALACSKPPNAAANRPRV
jgi:hypothetical protein